MSNCNRLALSLLAAMSLATSAARAELQTVTFNGFVEGDIILDQYQDLGLRIAPDDRGGPFYDDAGTFAFLLHTPEGVLNFNPLTIGSGPGRVHASVGTYQFDFVDPLNPAAPAQTDHVEVVVALVDRGLTVLTAYGADGEVLDTDSIELGNFEFNWFILSVDAPGIRMVTLATPLQGGTIGCVVDTVIFETPAAAAREIDIDIRPGALPNVIRLDSPAPVFVAILSEPGFRPAALDLSKVRFQGATPLFHFLWDLNRDRVRDVILAFRSSDLEGLTRESTSATLSAVDLDGTLLVGTDSVMIRLRNPLGSPVQEP